MEEKKFSRARMAFHLVLSRLVMDGTVGLSLRGKYLDKEARRTT